MRLNVQYNSIRLSRVKLFAHIVLQRGTSFRSLQKKKQTCNLFSWSTDYFAKLVECKTIPFGVFLNLLRSSLEKSADHDVHVNARNIAACRDRNLNRDLLFSSCCSGATTPLTRPMFLNIWEEDDSKGKPLSVPQCWPIDTPSAWVCKEAMANWDASRNQYW